MPTANRPARPWRRAILTAALLLCTGARADLAEEDTLKAGFLLNFARYTEWPPAALGSGDLLVCSLGSQSLSGKMEGLQGRQVQGRQIRVRAPVRQNEWQACHVLFIAAEDRQRLPAVLDHLDRKPVLTVGDAPGFAQSGGIIGLKLRAGRIRFDINQGAARRAGLNLSSQLLKLADEVIQ